MEKVEFLVALAETQFSRGNFSSSVAHYEKAKLLVDRMPDLNLGIRAAEIHFQIALCLFNLSKPKDAILPCMWAESLCKQLLKELTNKKYMSLTGVGLSLSKKEEKDLEYLPVYSDKIQKKLKEIWDFVVPIPEIRRTSQVASTTPLTKPADEESVPTEQSRFSQRKGTAFNPHGVNLAVLSTSTARITKRPKASELTSATPVTETTNGESVPTEQSRFFWQKDTAYSPGGVSVAIPSTSIARETRHQDDKSYLTKRHKSSAGIDASYNHSPQDMTKKAENYMHLDTTNHRGGIKLSSPLDEDEESDS